ncbi:hypothetical protein Bca101_075883 [Brassica carinata]|uniref:Prefoldin subunit 6 n=1 Tax=Brassica oleracea var. oleracea TaxID=109376 RepID=A0A0D3D5V3_BRAOL
MSSSSMALRDMQRDLEAKANDLAKIQKEIAKNHQLRKKYTIQLGENELVLKELDLLEDDANVYKLIGPVLVKQDLAEANANVRKRIEYISAELYVFFLLLLLLGVEATVAKFLLLDCYINLEKKRERSFRSSPMILMNAVDAVRVLDMKRIDATLQDNEGQQNSKREAMMKLQQRLQSIQAGKAKA